MICLARSAMICVIIQNAGDRAYLEKALVFYAAQFEIAAIGRLEDLQGEGNLSLRRLVFHRHKEVRSG